MGIFILTTVGSEAAFDWLDDEALEKGWVRAHTRHTKHGDIQIKAHYDRRTKKMEVPTPRRKARVKEQPPEATHSDQAVMVQHAKEIATAIKKLDSGTHDFKTGDHTPEQASANLKNQLKHLVSKIQQHKIDHHGGFTADELKSGMHKKSGKIAEVNGKELHANFEAKGNHQEFTPSDHVEAAKVHQELTEKAVDLHRGADAGGDSAQAKQHLEAALHHGAQETMHKMEAIEKKQAAKKEKAKAAKGTGVGAEVIRTGNGEFEIRSNGEVIGEIMNGSRGVSGRGRNMYGIKMGENDVRWVGSLNTAKRLGMRAAEKHQAGAKPPEVKAPEEKPTKAEKQPKLSVAQAKQLETIRDNPGKPRPSAKVVTYIKLSDAGLIELDPGKYTLGGNPVYRITDAGKSALDAHMKNPASAKASFEAQQRIDKTNFSRHASKFMSYDASDPWQIQQIEHLNKVPEHVFDSVMNAGHEVYLGEGSVVGLDDMKNILEKEGGKTFDKRAWDQVGGCYQPRTKKIVVGTLSKGYPVGSPALHEFGHAAGYTHKINGLPAQSHPKFSEHWDVIKSGLSPYFSDPKFGKGETFAECFNLANSNEKAARKQFGDDMVNWMRDKVLTDPNSLAGETLRAKEALAKERAKSTDPKQFADGVKQALEKVGPEGRFGSERVFISEAWKQMQATGYKGNLDEFKNRLIDANQKGHLTLHRADLVSQMDPQKVKDSHIQHPLGPTFNFIEHNQTQPQTQAPPVGAAQQPGAQQPINMMGAIMDGYRAEVSGPRLGMSGATIPFAWKHYSERAKAAGITPDRALFEKTIMDAKKQGRMEVTPHGGLSADLKADAIKASDAGDYHYYMRTLDAGLGKETWKAPAPSTGPGASSVTATQQHGETPQMSELLQHYHDEVKTRGGLSSVEIPAIWKRYSEAAKARGATPDKAEFDRVLKESSSRGESELTPHERPTALSEQEKNDSIVTNKAANDVLHFWRPTSVIAEATKRQTQAGRGPAAPADKPTPAASPTEKPPLSKPAEKPPLPTPKAEPKAGKGRGTTTDSGLSVHEVKDRIRKEYKEHTGVEEGQMMRLHDLRQRMSDVPRERLDRALKVMHANGEGTLTHKGKASYTTEKSKEDIHAALHHEGENNHKFMIGTKETKPGLKTEKKEKPSKGLAGMAESVKARSEATQANRISEIQDRIRQEYKAHTGKEHGERMHIHELRSSMPDVSRKDLDEAMLDMQKKGHGVLYQLDDPVDRTRKDNEAALDVLGNKRHVLYLEEQKKAAKSSGPEKKKEKPTKREKEK